MDLLITATLRLLAAFSFAALIGWERQIRNHTSGLRTTVLVSLAAATFCLPVETLANADPTRVPAGLVSGVGFLASAYIFKDQQQIAGLATAATIFSAAAVGTLCGLGYWQFAGISTLFVLFTNLVLRRKS
jgi:putative Mg2+ transporter-C (MgtC) family protein